MLEDTNSLDGAQFKPLTRNKTASFSSLFKHDTKNAPESGIFCFVLVEYGPAKMD